MASSCERRRSGAGGGDPLALRELLASRGLTFVAFSSGALRLDARTFDDDMTLHMAHARFVRDAGGTFLQVTDERPRVPPTQTDFAATAARLTELGRRTADIGITLGYHSHMGTLGETPVEVEAVLTRADPRYVRLLLDVAHWQAAGGDPVAAVRRHVERLAFLHLKDVQRPTGDTVRARGYRFVELGKGEVDVRGVLAGLGRVAFDGWAIVDFDAVTSPSLTPRACAEISKAFLASSGYTF